MPVPWLWLCDQPGKSADEQSGSRLEGHELRSIRCVNVYKSGDFLDIDMEIAFFISEFILPVPRKNTTYYDGS